MISRPQRWGPTRSHTEPGSQTQCRYCVTKVREPLGSSSAGAFYSKATEFGEARHTDWVGMFLAMPRFWASSGKLST